MLAGIVLLAGGGAVAAQSPSAGAPEPGAWFTDLAPGTCFEVSVDAQGFIDFARLPQVVPCAQPHGNEVVARVSLGDGDALPADLETSVPARCTQEVAAFLGGPAEEVGLFAFPVWPDAADWDAGVREAVCSVAGSGLIGTARSGSLRAPGEVIAAWWQPADRAELWLFDGGTGAPLTQVTDGTQNALLGPPSWSSDAATLLFAVGVSDEDTQVHRVAAEGGPSTVLVDGPGRQDAAVFAPDGVTLAYISNEAGGEYDIFVGPVGKTGSPITDHPGRDATPRYSPDGSQILFRRVTDGLSEIWVMAADGSDARRLIDNGVDSYDPRWSPDGATILFTTDLAGSFDIWAADADGTNVRPLTDHPGAEEYPTFSSDGRFIAFQSDRYGAPTLWLMTADGGEASVLTRGIAPVGYPSFSPLGDGSPG
jgi:TolB protein